MAEEEIEEFVAHLHRRVQERLEAEPELMARDAFVRVVADYLVDDGTLDDLDVCYLHLPWQNRTVEVAGYDIAGDGSILHLVVTIFGELGATVRRDRIEQMIRRAMAFADFCRSGQHEILERSSPTYDMAERIHANWPNMHSVRVFLLTDGTAGIRKMPEVATIAGLPATVQLWDAVRLQRLASSGRRQEEILIDLPARGYAVPCLPSTQQADGYECLLAVLPGRLLAELYGEFHSRLLQRNVRAFLQARGKVNKGIAETIRSQPGRFLAYNNGVSATAREAQFEYDERGALILSGLTDLQIVNGGQTTASLHHAAGRGIDLGDVNVPAKITLIADDRLDEMVPAISRYANSQNAVTAADFEGNSPFHVGLERLSRSVWAPQADGALHQTRWYYERVRGQYDVDRGRFTKAAERSRFDRENPRRQRFGKTDAAKYELAYGLRPDVVCQGGEKCFRSWTLDGDLAERPAPESGYFRDLVAKAILFVEVRRIIQKENFGGYLGQTTAHAIALMVERLGGLSLDLVWRAQHLPDPLSAVVLDVARHVRAVLVDPPGSANVTEWCKKEACWQRVRTVDWTPSPELKQFAR